MTAVYKKRSESELRALYFTFKQILKSVKWEIQGRIYTATMSYQSNGIKAKLTRYGVEQLAVYGVLHEHLVNLSKSGAEIGVDDSAKDVGVGFKPDIAITTPGFLRHCPRHQLHINDSNYLDRFPAQACEYALGKILSLPRGDKLLTSEHNQRYKHIINRIKKSGADARHVCPWHVIDEDARYCYWLWEANPVNNVDHTLESISLIFGTTCINVWYAEKRSLERLRDTTDKGEISNLLTSVDIW